MATNTTNLQSQVSKLKYENDSIKEALNQIMSEYADYRIECDEICKEYEETIQLLSDSLEKYKTENSKLNTEKEKMKLDQDKLTKELEKAREKNRDKIKDIEILNNKLDQLQSQFKSINKKETTLKTKVVTLETDNDHYLNKIHQYEEEVTDLKDNLENTIESLITTQNDFEEYKNKKEEELERLKLKLQEEKENVTALMNNKLNKKHTPLVTFKNDDKIEVLKPIDELNLENKNEKVILRGKKPKKDSKKETKNDEEQDNAWNRGRIGRAMTLQKHSYNFGDLFDKLRRRKEELVQFNKEIKKDVEKFNEK